jgi:hypothetical protein
MNLRTRLFCTVITCLLLGGPLLAQDPQEVLKQIETKLDDPLYYGRGLPELMKPLGKGELLAATQHKRAEFRRLACSLLVNHAETLTTSETAGLEPLLTDEDFVTCLRRGWSRQPKDKRGGDLKRGRDTRSSRQSLTPRISRKDHPRPLVLGTRAREGRNRSGVPAKVFVTDTM